MTKTPEVDAAPIKPKGMNLFKTMATDQSLEEDGVWIELDPDLDCAIKLARVDNKEYVALQQKLLKPYRDIFAANPKYKLPDNVVTDMLIQMLAKTVIIDWRNMLDESDKPMPCTLENKVKLLREVKDFRSLVSNLAGNADNFRRKELEAKN